MIWWWKVDCDFKAEMQTLQVKLNACLGRQIKYHIRSMFCIQWEEQRYSLKVFEASYHEGWRSLILFSSEILLPLVRLIFERPEILQPHNVPVRSVCTTSLILQVDCMLRDFTVNQKAYDKALYFSFLCFNLYPSLLPSCGVIPSWNRQLTVCMKQGCTKLNLTEKTSP